MTTEFWEVFAGAFVGSFVSVVIVGSYLLPLMTLRRSGARRRTSKRHPRAASSKMWLDAYRAAAKKGRL